MNTPVGRASTSSARINQIEAYARRTLTETVAHDFKHLDRVRGWAIQIARAEGYPDLDRVQAAALLHDIGLPCTEKRRQHGLVGARMAADYLRQEDLFIDAEIDEITHAIRFHNRNRQGHGPLLTILRDADILDLLGAQGILRAATFRADSPDFPAGQPKGDTWGFSAPQFDECFDRGIGVGPYLVDHINFQLSCYDNLGTDFARAKAQPLVAFMRAFMLQLEVEVIKSQGG
jgi:putative nucleotidyltransferase with HDIG domain